MKNVEISIQGSKMIIEVDLSKSFGRSSSGKSIIIATTEGNTEVDPNTGAMLGLNVYRKG